MLRWESICAGPTDRLAMQSDHKPARDTRYAVRDPEDRWASGRAEDSIFFSQKNHVVDFFVKKKKRSTMRPQAILPFAG